MEEQNIEGVDKTAQTLRDNAGVLDEIFKNIDANKDEMLSAINNNSNFLSRDSEKEREKAIKNRKPQAEQEVFEEEEEESEEEEPEEEESQEEEPQEEEEESEEEESEEEEPEEEEEEGVVLDSKKKHKLKQENYRLIAQLQEKENLIREANARIEALAQSEQQQLENAIYYYEKDAQANLAAAKQALKEAKDEFDTDKEIDAQQRLYDAINRVKEIENYRQNAQYQIDKNQQYQQQQLQNAQYRDNQVQQQPSSEEIARQATQNWISNHDVLNPAHRHFKEDIRNKLLERALKYENDLKAKGKDHLIFSDAYFNRLDGYLEVILEQETEKINKQRAANKVSTAHIASAKSSKSPTSTLSSSKSFITPEQEQWIEDTASQMRLTGKAKEEFRASWIASIPKKINKR